MCWHTPGCVGNQLACYLLCSSWPCCQEVLLTWPRGRRGSWDLSCCRTGHCDSSWIRRHMCLCNLSQMAMWVGTTSTGSLGRHPGNNCHGVVGSPGGLVALLGLLLLPTPQSQLHLVGGRVVPLGVCHFKPHTPASGRVHDVWAVTPCVLSLQPSWMMSDCPQRRWMRDGDRTSPTNTCATWRKPRGRTQPRARARWLGDSLCAWCFGHLTRLVPGGQWPG